MRYEQRTRGGEPLPIEARRALWRKVWDRLLAPEDRRDPAEVPAHARKDAPVDHGDATRGSR